MRFMLISILASRMVHLALWGGFHKTIVRYDIGYIVRYIVGQKVWMFLLLFYDDRNWSMEVFFRSGRSINVRQYAIIHISEIVENIARIADMQKYR